MSFANGNDRAGIPTVDTAMDCISNAVNKIKRAYNYDEIMSIENCLTAKQHLVTLEKNLERLKDVIPQQKYLDVSLDIKDLEDKIGTEICLSKESMPNKIPRLSQPSKKGNSFCDIDGKKVEHFLSLGLNVKEIACDGLLERNHAS